MASFGFLKDAIFISPFPLLSPTLPNYPVFPFFSTHIPCYGELYIQFFITFAA